MQQAKNKIPALKTYFFAYIFMHVIMFDLLGFQTSLIAACVALYALYQLRNYNRHLQKAYVYFCVTLGISILNSIIGFVAPFSIIQFVASLVHLILGLFSGYYFWHGLARQAKNQEQQEIHTEQATQDPFENVSLSSSFKKVFSFILIVNVLNFIMYWVSIFTDNDALDMGSSIVLFLWSIYIAYRIYGAYNTIEAESLYANNAGTKPLTQQGNVEPEFSENAPPVLNNAVEEGFANEEKEKHDNSDSSL